MYHTNVSARSNTPNCNLPYIISNQYWMQGYVFRLLLFMLYLLHLDYYTIQTTFPGIKIVTLLPFFSCSAPVGLLQSPHGRGR